MEAPLHVPDAQVPTVVVVLAPEKRYLVFVASAGTVTVMVADGFAAKLCGVPSHARVVGPTPAPESVIVPCGPELATVQVMGCVTGDTKFAVSLIAEFIVIIAGLAEPVNEPLPVPVQLLNANPLFAVAEIWTDVPESYHPVSPVMDGLVVAVDVPPEVGELENVTWYCGTVTVVIAWAADIEIAFRIVTVPVVDTGVEVPPLIE